MEPDAMTRPDLGVLVTLVELGNGESRVVLDDVRSVGGQGRDRTWQFDLFYTHKRLSTQALHDMALSNEEYRDFGIAVMARLIAMAQSGETRRRDI
jgi:plasmid replication initiation protein